MNRKAFLLTIIVLLFIFIIYRFYFNLSLIDWPIGCWVKKYIGLDCASCGIQRSLFYLFKGNLINAIKMNSLFIILLPLWIYLLYKLNLMIITNKWDSFTIKKLVYFILIGIIFMIIRNLDFYHELIEKID